jgi:hypothetical protein
MLSTSFDVYRVIIKTNRANDTKSSLIFNHREGRERQDEGSGGSLEGGSKQRQSITARREGRREGQVVMRLMGGEGGLARKKSDFKTVDRNWEHLNSVISFKIVVLGAREHFVISRISKISSLTLLSYTCKNLILKSHLWPVSIR